MNATTLAPARKAAKAKPKAAPEASQQLSTGAVRAALTELADILCAASLGVPRDDCARLLDCASNAAERPLHLDGFDESDLVEIGVDAARDIIALVRAAGHFPEALAAGNRGHLIAQAEPLIERLTGTAKPFSTCTSVKAVVPIENEAVQQQAVPSPTHQARSLFEQGSERWACALAILDDFSNLCGGDLECASLSLAEHADKTLAAVYESKNLEGISAAPTDMHHAVSVLQAATEENMGTHEGVVLGGVLILMQLATQDIADVETMVTRIEARA